MLEKTRSRSKLIKVKKPPKKRKVKTKEENEHLNRVAGLGCIICGAAANVHHIREGQGMAQRASHFETIPLCYLHHQGSDGIHTIGTKAWRAKYGSELELLELTLKEVKRG